MVFQGRSILFICPMFYFVGFVWNESLIVFFYIKDCSIDLSPAALCGWCVCVCVCVGGVEWEMLGMKVSCDHPVLMTRPLVPLWHQGQTCVRTGGQGQAWARQRRERRRRSQETESSPLHHSHRNNQGSSLFVGETEKWSAPWWWWPSWRPRSTTTTASRRCTWPRRMSGTGTCCWTRPGSSSRGK